MSDNEIMAKARKKHQWLRASLYCLEMAGCKCHAVEREVAEMEKFFRVWPKLAAQLEHEDKEAA